MATNWSPDHDEWLASTEALFTLMYSQKYASLLLSKTSQSVRVHTTISDEFWTFHTKTFKNDRIARCYVRWLYAHATNTRPCDFFGCCFFFCVLHCFRPCTWNNTVSMRFRVNPLLRSFSDRCVLNENAQRVSVEGRPNIKTYRNVCVFKRNRSSVHQGRPEKE